MKLQPPLACRRKIVWISFLAVLVLTLISHSSEVTVLHLTHIPMPVG